MFCFGLALLEMIFTDMAAHAGQHAFKFLNWILNSGRKNKLLRLIEDETLKDFLNCALHEIQEERHSLKQLYQHAYFDPVNN